jgi:hypothetical protein
MDLNKLTPSEKIIGAAGILLFIDSFLPWFRFSVFGASATQSGWSNVFSLLAVLVAVVMVAQIILSKFTAVDLPNLGNLSWGQVHLFAGVGVLALVVLQFLIGDSPYGRAFGIYIGILLSAGLAYGGFMRSREPEAAGGGRASTL